MQTFRRARAAWCNLQEELKEWRATPGWMRDQRKLSAGARVALRWRRDVLERLTSALIVLLLIVAAGGGLVGIVSVLNRADQQVKARKQMLQEGIQMRLYLTPSKCRLAAAESRHDCRLVAEVTNTGQYDIVSITIMLPVDFTKGFVIDETDRRFRFVKRTLPWETNDIVFPGVRAGNKAEYVVPLIPYQPGNYSFS